MWIIYQYSQNIDSNMNTNRIEIAIVIVIVIVVVIVIVIVNMIILFIVRLILMLIIDQYSSNIDRNIHSDRIVIVIVIFDNGYYLIYIHINVNHWSVFIEYW